ncbi:MAG: methyltransferase domain-containing protein [Rhodospirillaceae bacterium]|jgi:trans-aconitate 2-methyltransferase|nr:methyltransferase domain-containing protein [Rhodospirillaceae bacterium]
MAWDPGQYLAFAGPRMQPAVDLLARVHSENPATIVDLGCGPGNITPMLQQRWPDATITGVDNSDEMLARARDAVPGVDFINQDIFTWEPAQKFDLLFSNAALQWVKGHDVLFPKVMSLVAPGGVAAIQIPRNFEAPSHTLMTDVINAGPWRELLTPVRHDVPTQRPEYYYDLLSPLVKTLDIWETEYLQILDGENPVAEYTKGSWLMRFLSYLDEPWKSEFETDYRARVLKAYPQRADGKTLFPFRRQFILATL